VGGFLYSISYLGGTGNDIELTSVPEPSGAVAVLGMLGGLALNRRRTRRL
jgi:hypothetical protein